MSAGENNVLILSNQVDCEQFIAERDLGNIKFLSAGAFGQVFLVQIEGEVQSGTRSLVRGQLTMSGESATPADRE